MEKPAQMRRMQSSISAALPSPPTPFPVRLRRRAGGSIIEVARWQLWRGSPHREDFDDGGRNRKNGLRTGRRHTPNGRNRKATEIRRKKSAEGRKAGGKGGPEDRKGAGALGTLRSQTGGENRRTPHLRERELFELWINGFEKEHQTLLREYFDGLNAHLSLARDEMIQFRRDFAAAIDLLLRLGCPLEEALNRLSRSVWAASMHGPPPSGSGWTMRQRSIPCP